MSTCMQEHARGRAVFLILSPSLLVLRVDVAFLILYPAKPVSPMFHPTIPVPLMLHAGVVPHTHVTFMILGNSAKLVYMSETPFVIFRARSCERLQLTLPGWFLIHCDQQCKVNLELWSSTNATTFAFAKATVLRSCVKVEVAILGSHL